VILIYTHHITPRVAYTIDLVFNSVLNIPYELTDNKENYSSSLMPKLAYTSINEGFDVFIQSNVLLFETGIQPVLPVADKSYTGFPKFFKSNSDDYLGYDVFAMVFYFASRYEEYLKTDTDDHQRFKAENSLAFQYNCLKSPFLNEAIHQFSIKLKQQFSSLNFEKRKFNFLSTVDIDNAFAYANKGFKRNFGGLVKDIFYLQLNKIAKRIESNFNSGNDPYNTFNFINNLSRDTQTALHYFVLIGDYSTYDKNPNYKNDGFRKLLRSLSNTYSIGLHPSYESFNYPEKIEIEKKRLEYIIEKKVTSARCHFLRVKFPQTYRTYIEQGITDDYTMIYASQYGFRTSLCVPYKWFDLERNESTQLTIHTSIIMEGTLRDYNKYSPEKANKVINQLLEETKKHGGEFVSVWHNDSFIPSQKEWIAVYKKLLENSKSNNS
jgi:hypothetical protein